MYGGPCAGQTFQRRLSTCVGNPRIAGTEATRGDPQAWPSPRDRAPSRNRAFEVRTPAQSERLGGGLEPSVAGEDTRGDVSLTGNVPSCFQAFAAPQTPRRVSPDSSSF